MKTQILAKDLKPGDVFIHPQKNEVCVVVKTVKTPAIMGDFLYYTSLKDFQAYFNNFKLGTNIQHNNSVYKLDIDITNIHNYILEHFT